MSTNGVPPSAPLSDSDAQTLYSYGQDIMQDAVGVIWETVFISVYGVFFAVAIYSIVRRGLKSRTSIVMLCVVLYLYATSLTLWALNLTNLFKTAHILFMDFPGMPLADRKDLANASLAVLGPPMKALFMFNVLTALSSGGHGSYTRVPSAIDITCLTGAGWSNQSPIAGGGAVCAHAELISWAFSLVTNASCTILIGFRAWQHRRAMRALQINSRRMSTERVLSLLVESGFIYCLFWLTQYILFVDISRDSPMAYVYEFFSSMGDQVPGMYPTLIIVIVNLHYTIWEESSSTIKIGTMGGAVSTLRWAVAGVTTGTTPSDTHDGGVDVVHLESMATDSDGVDVRARSRKKEAVETV
ncbi:hypothetical protein C8R46DRAFT_1285140 [Mycena filopes]|nr:hypothetical protein C8R46DRAFT_1285140 [Mycena filopes]